MTNLEFNEVAAKAQFVSLNNNNKNNLLFQCSLGEKEEKIGTYELVGKPQIYEYLGDKFVTGRLVRGMNCLL